MLTYLTNDWREGFALQRTMDDHAITFEIDQTNAPRIQTESPAELAAFIAQWGANQLKQPVIKTENGLFISALKGLPGVYGEMLQKKLGAKRLLQLMEGVEDRSAKLQRAVAFCEPGKNPFIFEGGSTGAITETVPKKSDYSLAEQLFVPEYRLLNQKQTKTLAELAESDPILLKHAWGDAEEKFATWYKSTK